MIAAVMCMFVVVVVILDQTESAESDFPPPHVERSQSTRLPPKGKIFLKSVIHELCIR